MNKLMKQIAEATPETALKACSMFLITMLKQSQENEGSDHGKHTLVMELNGERFTITVENGDQSDE